MLGDKTNGRRRYVFSQVPLTSGRPADFGI
jgi:hypothetical protein